MPQSRVGVDQTGIVCERTRREHLNAVTASSGGQGVDQQRPRTAPMDGRLRWTAPTGHVDSHVDSMVAAVVTATSKVPVAAMMGGAAPVRAGAARRHGTELP